MKIDKWLLVGVVALLVTVFVGAAWWYKKTEVAKIDANTQVNSEALVRAYSPTVGPADAPVTLVEFMDPECESCRLFHPLAKEAVKEFGGRVRLVIRYAPFHPNAAYAASALEAARKQGKYFEALDLLFAKQPEWGDHHHPKPELILVYLQTLGLDMNQLKTAMSDVEVQGRIKQDEADAKTLGITRTPTFFANGKMLDRLGAQELRDAINAALKK